MDINKHDNIGYNEIIQSSVNTPLISIIIPTYRRPFKVRKAIISAIQQDTNTNYEIVIVENTSDKSPETEAVIRSCKSDRISYYQNHDNIGMFGNWNRGLRLAKSEWVTILCDDDLIENDFISRATHIIKRTSYRFFCLKNEIFSKEDDLHHIRNNTFKQHVREKNKFHMLLSNQTSTVGNFYKRSIAIALGGFDESLYPSSDYDLYLRYINTEGPYLIDRSKSYGYFRMEGNTSSEIKVQFDFCKKDLILQKKCINNLKINVLKKRLMLSIIKVANRKRLQKLNHQKKSLLFKLELIILSFYTGMINFLYKKKINI
ncbi:glycosyltransferase [Halosquirtibacter xylanolyticus]|uniref:glycosyltransferase family 2 protein n=1 Tax=Halosquirtibacter xylanolyticus TaxID=3374599 RepID=UPI003747A52A|nr:glycosyltransferase [Prolixibacteraceae bacterium]